MNFTQTQVIETVAAFMNGKRFSLDLLKTIAMDGGSAAILEFREAVRARFAEVYSQAPKASLAVMQKAKVPGVSTFYTYTQRVLALQTKFERGNLDAGVELASLTTGKLTSAQDAPKAKTSKPKTEAPAAAPAPTIEGALAFLQDAHKAGALTAAHYAALQALTMAPARSNVVDMGAAVEVTRELLAA